MLLLLFLFLVPILGIHSVSHFIFGCMRAFVCAYFMYDVWFAIDRESMSSYIHREWWYSGVRTIFGRLIVLRVECLAECRFQTLIILCHCFSPIFSCLRLIAIHTIYFNIFEFVSSYQEKKKLTTHHDGCCIPHGSHCCCSCKIARKNAIKMPTIVLFIIVMLEF